MAAASAEGGAPTAEAPVTVKGGKPKLTKAQRSKRLRVIFILMAMVSIIINLDGGAVPQALQNIIRTYDLSLTESGLLGMLVYQGIAIGSLTVGPTLQCISARRATQCTLVLNTAATLLFGMSSSAGMLLAFRILIGFLQAVPAVYFPVWVDEFAPPESATLWMAVVQAGAPLGIMCGYVVAYALTGATIKPCEPTDVTCGWRIPFYAQSCILVCFSIGSIFLPAELYDLGQAKDAADDEEEAKETTEAAATPAATAADTRAQDAAATSVTTTRMSHYHQGASSMAPAIRPSSMLRDSFAHFTLEAFQPLGAGRLLEAPDQVPDESPEDAERKKRMEARMKRCSTVGALPLPAPPATGAIAEEGEAAAPLGGIKTPSAPDQITIEGLPSPRQALSFADPGLEPVRMSLAMETEDGGSKVVSAVDLFSSDTIARLSRASHTKPTTPRTPRKPAKPTLESVESGVELSGRAEDAGASSTKSTASDANDPPKKVSPLMQLLSNPVYCWTVFAIAALFFVVTGIQFWITTYMTVVIGPMPRDENGVFIEGAVHITKATVTPAFSVVSITAPLLGVFLGGVIIDKLGGYKGASALALTLKCCALFSGCAGATAVVSAYAPKLVADPFGGFYLSIGLIAVTLLFGGATIPAATGVIISSVPEDLRQLSSALSMFAFQQLGYALSPLVSSLVGNAAKVDEEKVLAAYPGLDSGNTVLTAQIIADAKEKEKLELCFSVVMWWAVLGVVSLTIAWRYAVRDYKKLLAAQASTKSAKGSTKGSTKQGSTRESAGKK